MRQSFFLVSFLCFSSSLFAQMKVIAHRGASGTLPEHTLPAYALAAGMGAHYLEPDVVVTKDKVPFIRHEHDLKDSSNVKEVFPEKVSLFRGAPIMGFTENEVRQLHARERVSPFTGEAVYPNRFQSGVNFAPLVSLEEFLVFVSALNKNRGEKFAIYPEIKEPREHAAKGIDSTDVIYQMLKKYDYENKPQEIFLQCFEFTELVRLKKEYKTKIPLIYLTESKELPLKEIKKIVVGIGCPIQNLITKVEGKWQASELMKALKKEGLQVHPYTLRADALPEGFTSFEDLLYLLEDIGVDAVFTDFPGRAREALEKRARKNA